MNNFFLELLVRLFADTPWFFRVVRIISIIASLLTGIPALLQGAGITLPGPIDAVASDVVAIAALVAAFIAQLTVTAPVKKREDLKD